MARNDPNADNKRDEALAYVRRQKAQWGTGVSTLCFFYNATGETLFFDGEHSWFGRIYGSYPLIVQNGQWGAFLHVKRTAAASGSMGYVLYRVKGTNDAGYLSSLIGWDNPWNKAGHSNKAFCDVYEDGKIVDNNEIYNAFSTSSRIATVRKMGMWITATIDTINSPLFEAYFNLEEMMLKLELA
ncbi:cytolysin/lectin [Artemisia annua]|nr:cytolysin/lectin [Artemisia annua]